MKQKVNCTFDHLNWSPYDQISYSCMVKNMLILENEEIQMIGKHIDGETNLTVEAIAFINCGISRVPRGLTITFPNLKKFEIKNSNLMRIVRGDLKEYARCKQLHFSNNQIIFLPGDLLDDCNELDVLCFGKNKIQKIGTDLYNKLKYLKYVNLSGSISRRDEMSPEKTSDAKSKSGNGIYGDLNKIIRSDEFKDFTILVGEEKFKVHKFLLAARSQVLADIIKNNIHAECFNLVDISVEIFREILKFIYTDELSNDNIDFLHLFKAAEKLKIQNLSKLTIEKLIMKVNAENAFEMLTLSNKFNNEELRKKSFDEIKKFLGNESIDDRLAQKTDILEEIIKCKKEKDRMDAKLKDLMKFK